MDANIRHQILQGICFSKKKLLKAIEMCDEMEASLTIETGTNSSELIEKNACLTAESCYQIKLGMNMIECLIIEYGKDD